MKVFLARQEAGASVMKWPASQCGSGVLVACLSHVHRAGPHCHGGLEQGDSCEDISASSLLESLMSSWGTVVDCCLCLPDHVLKQNKRLCIGFRLSQGHFQFFY